MLGSRATVWIYLVLVFAGGAGVGAFADRLYTAKSVKANTREGPHTPEDYRKRYTDELRRRLNLTTEQVSQLNAILEVTQQKMRSLHERDKPEMTAIHQDQVKKFHEILNETQDAEYDKMREEREKKRAEERH